MEIRITKTALVAAAGVLVAAAVLSSAVSFGTKHYVCNRLANVSQGGDAPEGESKPLDRAAVSQVRWTLKLLFVHPELREAMEGLLDDAEDMEAASAAAENQDGLEALPGLLAIGSRIDGHMRDAQRACGQPPTGIWPAGQR